MNKNTMPVATITIMAIVPELDSSTASTTAFVGIPEIKRKV